MFVLNEYGKKKEKFYYVFHKVLCHFTIKVTINILINLYINIF